MSRPGLVLLAGALLAGALGGAGAADPDAARRTDSDAVRRLVEPCGGCHGPDGNATVPGMPSLAGMPAYYTHWQLIMFRDGRRPSPVMAPFAAALRDDDLAAVAAFYEAQVPRPRPAPVDPRRAALGRPLADAHRCTACHRPDLMGQHQVPRLAGQDLQYLLERLRGYRARTTSDLDGMMTMIAQALSDEDIQNLAHFLASVPPRPRAEVAPATP